MKFRQAWKILLIYTKNLKHNLFEMLAWFSQSTGHEFYGKLGLFPHKMLESVIKESFAEFHSLGRINTQFVVFFWQSRGQGFDIMLILIDYSQKSRAGFWTLIVFCKTLVVKLCKAIFLRYP